MSYFSMLSLILLHPKSLSQLSQSFFLKFHIEIAYDTLQSLNYAADQLGLKLFLPLSSKLTYSLYLLIFLGLSKSQIYFPS